MNAREVASKLQNIPRVKMTHDEDVLLDNLAAFLVSLDQRNAGLRDALTEIRDAIESAPPEVLTDTLWASPIETAVDRINAALAA